MYFKFCRINIIRELYYIKNGKERQLDFTIPRLIAKENKSFVFIIWLKMVFSLIMTGCTFKEYYNLNFINRTIKNQMTFLTTGSNIEAYNILNDKSFNHLYLNKDEFNKKYSEFIAREWISLSEDKEQIYSFFKKHKDIIIKPRTGDSGKGIEILCECDKLSFSEIDDLISEKGEAVAEEVLYNHPALNELNESSLNTMRVITVRNGEKMDVLFAGIRFGKKGCKIDNISVGGRIAPIDLVSGKICALSHTKKTVTDDNEVDKDYIGFQIPMWDELNEYLYKLTAVVPQMRYMAWDIAITRQGFAVIEGNHSSGNTISQGHLSETQQGLKVKLNECIEQINRQTSLNNQYL